jgi:hypothetical protein
LAVIETREQLGRKAAVCIFRARLGFLWYRNVENGPGDDVSDHKFKVGQTVHYQSGPYGSVQRGDVFKIVQRLPPQGGDYQYRIKSNRKPHDRVAKEGELERVID